MTQYWWMHWFWITLLFYREFSVAVGHSMLSTLHSNSTGALSNSTLASPSETNITAANAPLIPPRILSPIILRNMSQYFRNVSVSRPRQFSKKLGVLPLEAPTNENVSSFDNNTNRVLAVINQKTTESSHGGNFAGSNSNGNKTFSSGNQTENVTDLGKELSYNHSFIQSERIGIEEQDLNIDVSTGNLSAAGITGITLGCIIIVGVICGVSFFVYRYQGLNRPQVLNDRCSNPDSSGYIDDASVRDNSEEMYSLDNDSFLNSLEAMTIQNYWTDTVKHTKL